jgi:hypothetical protein
LVRRRLSAAQHTSCHNVHVHGAPRRLPDRRFGHCLPRFFVSTDAQAIAGIEFDGSALVRQDVTWPEPEIVEFPLLNEALPVYSGSFELRGRLLLKFPLPDGELILQGRLRFQQCGKNVCEPPQVISFELPLMLAPFIVSDRDRKLLDRHGPKS